MKILINRMGLRLQVCVGTFVLAQTFCIALMSSENRAAPALGRNYPGGLPAFECDEMRRRVSWE